MSFYNYVKAYNVNNTKIGTISYYPDPIKYKSYYKKYKISAAEVYRPDKIAYNLFDDQKLWWVLDIINNFTNLDDYYIGREIYYLDKSYLDKLGLY